MRLGITMGDASGVGPEILLQAWTAGVVDKQLLVYGDAAVLKQAQGLLSLQVPMRVINDAS